MKRRQKAGAQSWCATARTAPLLRSVAREAAHRRSPHPRIRFAASGWKPELRGGGYAAREVRDHTSTTHGTCSHGLRRPPQSHMQRSRGGRTHGICRHGLLRPPRSHTQRSRGGRTHGPAAMACSDRHGRTCSEAEMAAWTAPVVMVWGCATAAARPAVRIAHSRPSRRGCRMTAARGHSAVRRLRAISQPLLHRTVSHLRLQAVCRAWQRERGQVSVQRRGRGGGGAGAIQSYGRGMELWPSVGGGCASGGACPGSLRYGAGLRGVSPTPLFL
jgi:hypothetical protein